LHEFAETSTEGSQQLSEQTVDDNAVTETSFLSEHVFAARSLHAGAPVADVSLQQTLTAPLVLEHSFGFGTAVAEDASSLTAEQVVFFGRSVGQHPAILATFGGQQLSAAFSAEHDDSVVVPTQGFLATGGQFIELFALQDDFFEVQQDAFFVLPPQPLSDDKVASPTQQSEVSSLSTL
jgi:hypothetical protein